MPSWNLLRSTKGGKTDRQKKQKRERKRKTEIKGKKEEKDEKKKEDREKKEKREGRRRKEGKRRKGEREERRKAEEMEKRSLKLISKHQLPLQRELWGAPRRTSQPGFFPELAVLWFGSLLAGQAGQETHPHQAPRQPLP